MKIGYACINLSLPVKSNHRCMLKNATDNNLRRLIKKNLDGLKEILLYNIAHNMLLFRISSDIIPFASHPVNNIDWTTEFTPELNDIKKLINSSCTTVSMHPGQYTVLNSPKAEVVKNSIAELDYHCKFLDSITDDLQHKIVLHIGGIYESKKQAMQRFISNFLSLEKDLQKRIIIENDDRMFNIEDVLHISNETGAPVVFDYFHHVVNHPSNFELCCWFNRILNTWKPEDGTPKCHYSDQAPFRTRGAHSEQVNLINFIKFIKLLPQNINIMLETKDKNLSAERVINILSGDTETLKNEYNRCEALVKTRDFKAARDLQAYIHKHPNYAVFFIKLDKILETAPAKENLRQVFMEFYYYLEEKADVEQRIELLNLINQEQLEDAAKKCYTAGVTYKIKPICDSYIFNYPDIFT